MDNFKQQEIKKIKKVIRKKSVTAYYGEVIQSLRRIKTSVEKIFLYFNYQSG